MKRRRPSYSTSLFLRLLTLFCSIAITVCQSRYGLARTVIDVCPFSGEPARSRDSGNIVWCKTGVDCPDNYECTTIVGLVHFGTQIRYCCPTRISVCSLPADPGYGDCAAKPSIAYYFDLTQLQCNAFKVVNCHGGNANRFETLDECKRRCEATACEAGETMLTSSSGNHQPVFCGDDGNCPGGYSCRYDALFRRHICCGYKKSGACPAGHRTYMNTITSQPMVCRLNYVRDECPADHVCTSNGGGTNHCCSLEHGICPAGQTPYIHPLTDRSIKCNPVRYMADCPRGFMCAASVIGSNWGFCCSEEIKANCPENSAPLISSHTNLPMKCTVGVTVCSAGYECLNRDSKALIGFCCTIPSPALRNVQQPVEIVPIIPVNALQKSGITENTKTTGPITGSPIAALTRIISGGVRGLFGGKPATAARRTELRLVDIQKEIDRLDNRPARRFSLTHRLKSTPSLPSTISDGLHCPDENYEPILFPGTNLPLVCPPGRHCPDNGECLFSPGDHQHRSICCLPPTAVEVVDPREQYGSDEEDIAAGPMFSVPVQFVSTSDPYCPTVIEGRICQPGSVAMCTESGFFCQWNIARKNFMCCSMSVDGFAKS